MSQRCPSGFKPLLKTTQGAWCAVPNPTPGMQHPDDAKLAGEPSGSAAESKKSLRGCLEEQPVDERPRALGDGVELLGQGDTTCQ